MENFTKVVRIGKVTEGAYKPSVFCAIKFKDGHLSITGVVGPKSNGNCVGSCGQICMGFEEYYMGNPIEFAPGWDMETLKRFLALWDEWHLNDMKAGSPAQTAWLKANPVKASGAYADRYEMTKAALEAAGLQPDASHIVNGKPYSYGSAWLSVPVPDDVIEWLKALPDTDVEPAWV